MVLRFAEKGAEQVEIIRADKGLLKPRLAVIFDYLWYMKNCPPFEPRPGMDFSAGVSAPPISRRVDISAGGGGKFEFRANAEFLTTLYGEGFVNYAGSGGRPELPFESITLCAAHKSGKRPTQAMPPMRVETAPDGYLSADGSGRLVYALSAGPKELKDFLGNLTGMTKGSISDWLFFFSIKLTIPSIRLPEGARSLVEQYDVSTPWCYAVDVDTQFHLYLTRPPGKQGELPDYKAMRSFNEYK